MSIPNYLVEKLLRHGAAVERLNRDINDEDSEFSMLGPTTAIAFDAADFVWAFLVAAGCQEAQETREIRNTIAGLINNYIKSNELIEQETVTERPDRHVHPKRNEAGDIVHITHPTSETSIACWDDPTSIATLAPASEIKTTLNGVPFESWIASPQSDQQWSDVEGQHRGLFDEPIFSPVPGKRPAVGVVIEEVDGRVWVVHPTNGYAGYEATFPKGDSAGCDSLQAAAISEAYRKTGLKVAITGYLGDYNRGHTKARYYFARRVGGSPADMGWKSQAVSLIPLAKLSQILTHPNDRKLLAALISEKRPARRDIIKYEFGLTSGFRILAVLNGFRTKFKTWPIRLLVNEGLGRTLKTETLTPLGWQMLQGKLQVVFIDEGTVIAEGSNGERYDYADSFHELNSTEAPRADEWLWGITANNT